MNLATWLPTPTNNILAYVRNFILKMFFKKIKQFPHNLFPRFETLFAAY